MLAGQGIVEPAVQPELLDGDPAAIEAVDRHRQRAGARGAGRPREDLGRRRPDRVLRRAPADRIDASRWTRRSADVLRTGATRAELSDLSTGRRTGSSTDHGDLVRGLPSRARLRRHATPLRDVPAAKRGRSDRAEDLAPIRRAASSRASSCSGSSRCRSHGDSAGGYSGRRKSGRRSSSGRSRRPPTSGAGSRRTSMTAPSRIWRGSRTPRARPRRAEGARRDRRDAARGCSDDAGRDAEASHRCSSRSILRTCRRAGSRPRWRISLPPCARTGSRRSSSWSPCTAASRTRTSGSSIARRPRLCGTSSATRARHTWR